MNTVFKAACAYLIVLFAIRLVGRRTASQQAPIDMVVLFLFGGMSVSAILGDDHSFTGAMSALFTVGLMHIAVSWLKLRSLLIERIVDGTPIVVFQRGAWNHRRMEQLKLQQADVRTSARQQGIDDLDDVDTVIVERDGKLSIMKKAS